MSSFFVKSFIVFLFFLIINFVDSNVNCLLKFFVKLLIKSCKSFLSKSLYKLVNCGIIFYFILIDINSTNDFELTIKQKLVIFVFFLSIFTSVDVIPF